MYYVKLKRVALYRTEINACKDGIRKQKEKLAKQIFSDKYLKLQAELPKIQNYQKEMEQQLKTLITEIEEWLNTCDMDEDLKKVARYYYIDGHSEIETKKKFPYRKNFITEIKNYCRGFNVN